MSELVRTTIILDAALAHRIDAYWHTQRLPSRSEAIRQLVEAALKAARSAARKPRERP